MNNNKKTIFQIPNYNSTPNPEISQDTFHNTKKQTKKSLKSDENIFNDLLAKSQEISKARTEAAEFLRRMK